MKTVLVVKLFTLYLEIMIRGEKKVPANLVPAAAVRREGQALFGMIGRKEHVGGFSKKSIQAQGGALIHGFS